MGKTTQCTRFYGDEESTHPAFVVPKQLAAAVLRAWWSDNASLESYGYYEAYLTFLTCFKQNLA